MRVTGTQSFHSMRRLAHWFRDQSIDRKLNAITTSVILAVLLPVLGITLDYEYYSVRRALMQEIQVQADIIRDNSAAALAFQDVATATEVLETLRSSTSITQAQLSLPDGRVHARYMKEGAAPLAPLPEVGVSTQDTQEFTDDGILVVRKVYLKQQAVGWLLLEGNLDALYTRIRLYTGFILVSTFFALLFGRWLARYLITSITKPLSKLVNLSQHVASEEDYTLRQAVDSQDEIGDLSQAFNTMLSRIHERDVRLNHLAYKDNVTGLFNRHYFKERADQAVGNAMRYGSNCCLMFIDLDRFKAVNDTLGHDVGDELLLAVAQRLAALLRNNDVICRIGGDEFAVVLENVKNLGDLGTLAQKMVNSLAQVFHLRNEEIYIGASIGISICPDHASSVTDLLRCADIAMYQAKAQGRGCFCIYDASMKAPQ